MTKKGGIFDHSLLALDGYFDCNHKRYKITIPMKTKTCFVRRRITNVFLLVSLFTLTLISPALAQVKFNDANELRESGMGVERVARYYLPAYSSPAKSNNETKWVQIDLGSVKKVEAIKLLPGVQGWGPASGGFPCKFRLEVSNDADFGHSIMYEDYTLKGEFPIPDDEVSTFVTKEVSARYVRLTAGLLQGNPYISPLKVTTSLSTGPILKYRKNRFPVFLSSFKTGNKQTDSN